MMKKLKLFDSRIKILHQNARSLAGQHLLLKELIQDIGYNCIYAFSETWLSQNHPEEFWHVDKQNFDCFRKDRIQTTIAKGGGFIMYMSRKKLVKMFLEKLVLGIDLAMAEGKSVILAGDYNLNYFTKRDRSLLQSVISPYALKPTNNDTATRMTNSSSTLIEYIITDDYETGIVADTILKTDHFATITVLKSVMLKSKTTKKKFFAKKTIQP